MNEKSGKLHSAFGVEMARVRNQKSPANRCLSGVSDGERSYKLSKHVRTVRHAGLHVCEQILACTGTHDSLYRSELDDSRYCRIEPIPIIGMIFTTLKLHQRLSKDLLIASPS